LFDVNWYQSANIPNWQRIYTRAFDVDCLDNVNIFLASCVINKNKSPERHELIIIRGNMVTGEIRLVERLRKGKELNGNLGAITITVLPDNQLNVTVGYDNDPTANSMFLPKAGAFDGNVTREGNYNS
jgi:hypothetical protein